MWCGNPVFLQDDGSKPGMEWAGIRHGTFLRWVKRRNQGHSGPTAIGYWLSASASLSHGVAQTVKVPVVVVVVVVLAPLLVIHAAGDAGELRADVVFHRLLAPTQHVRRRDDPQRSLQPPETPVTQLRSVSSLGRPWACEDRETWKFYEVLQVRKILVSGHIGAVVLPPAPQQCSTTNFHRNICNTEIMYSGIPYCALPQQRSTPTSTTTPHSIPPQQASTASLHSKACCGGLLWRYAVV
eukprot:gene7103-biopygen21002